MAKKQRVTASTAATSRTTKLADQAAGAAERPDPLAIALGLLAAALVYVTYFPSDSVAVEKGDALWFAFVSLSIATTSLGYSLARPIGDHDRSPLSIGLDVAPWLLAGWMTIVAVMSSPPGNLRMATNEAWVWCAGAAVFTSARRLLADLSARQAVLMLVVGCALALSVHALHQSLISLPATRAEYRADPEKLLAEAGYDAPQGSSERMVFENRLFDGGPTATFALANSLAAVLLASSVLAVGVLRCRWPSLSTLARIGWTVAALLCLAGLLAARSRSATLALVLAVVFLGVTGTRHERLNVRHWLLGLISLLAIGAVGMILLALFGSREWFAQAPASLAFRFQYWRSTWQMTLDHPWTGAGPGNFQSIYERYREPSASEVVAEPHNFFFETLASGGFVAAGILLGLLAAASVWTFRHGLLQRSADGHPSRSTGQPAADTGHVRWVWLGAVLGLVMVWVIGASTGSIPDVDAHLIAIPIAALLVLTLWPSLRELAERETDLIALASLGALMTHLLVSGGWTVPGVAIIAWLLAAALLGLRRDGPGDRSEAPPPAGAATAPNPSGLTRPIGTFVAPWAVTLTCVCLLLALYGLSIRPVERQQSLLRSVAHLQTTGRVGRAGAELQAAMAADPWSADAAIWMADYTHWQLVLDRITPATRAQWDGMIQEAKRGGGDDPAIYRMLGAQQIHLYQRYGQREDLLGALETFGTAAGWSPANEWLAAQTAAVCDAAGQPDQASVWAERALHLSGLGGNMERSLKLQQIYVAREIGPAVRGGPHRQAAMEVLANHFHTPDVDPPGR